MTAPKTTAQYDPSLDIQLKDGCWTTLGQIVATVQAETENKLTDIDLNWHIGDMTIHYLPKHILEAALAHREES